MRNDIQESARSAMKCCAMPAPSTPGGPSTRAETAPGGYSPEQVYRGAAITGERLARFVAVFLRELFERDGARYDAVYMAYAESGIQPLPSIQCEGAHYDAKVEGVNRIADALADAIYADRGIHEALVGIASTVLGRLTVPAPAGHLTVAELHQFVACCSRDDGRHIAEYGTYAVLHAHLGICALCDVRMRLTHDKVPPVSAFPRMCSQEK